MTVGDIFNKFKSTRSDLADGKATQIEVLQAIVENTKISLRKTSQNIPIPAQNPLPKLFSGKIIFTHKTKISSQSRDLVSYLFCSRF